MNTMTVEVVVPDWTRWMAVQPDGWVVAYEHEPHMDGEHWLRDLYSNAAILYKGPPPKNWKEELYTWS